MRSLLLLFLPSLALAAPKPDSSSSYGAPHAPVYDSYSAPSAPTYAKQQYYPPQQQYVNPPDSHVHHHYYHQAQPVVQVPITPQPYVVQVPQNVPVQFVPINVDVPPPQYQTVPVHLAPQQGYVLPGGFGGGFGGGFDDPYIKRKELIKSGLLLGAGVIKGALVTTLINQATQNGK